MAAALPALLALAAAGMRAQQQPAANPSTGDVFASQGQPAIYSDQYSSDCEAQNANNPWAGTNPLTCHGETMPPVGNVCTFPGMTLLKKINDVCYYCLPINPPTIGIILPIDVAGVAEKQGYRCGGDQADVCMLICTGIGPFKPPPGVTLSGPPPAEPPNTQPPPVQSPPGTPVIPTQLQFGSPQDPCAKNSFADVPGATPQLRYGLGFENGFKECLVSQLTVQNLGVAVLASRFKTVAALLKVTAAPGVIDAVLNPPGTSKNPNPYLQGQEEGTRLCEWAIKISPALVRKCPAAIAPAITLKTSPSVCTKAQLAAGLTQAMGNAAGQSAERFDCVPCTLAWLKNEPYTPPANGGTPWTWDEVTGYLKSQYGNITPQGPGLPCWRESAQKVGYPGSMSPAGIQSEMMAAGDGAEGIIFIDDPAVSNTGHVFAVRTQGSGANAKVIYWDEQQQMQGNMWFTPGLWIALYRTK
jgi:hypothetical protein